MDLDGRERELLGDLAILDLDRVADLHALDPLGHEARAGDRAAAAVGLELGVGDHVALDADLQLHHVPARGRADDTGSHAGLLLV